MQIKMFKSVFVIAVLLVVKVLATPLNTRLKPYGPVEVIQLEEPCVVQGGLCMRIEDCNPSDIVQLRDLCPKQTHLGVACCYLQ